MDYLLIFIATVSVGLALVDRILTRLTTLKPGEAPLVPLLAFLCQWAMLLYLMLHALP